MFRLDLVLIEWSFVRSLIWFSVILHKRDHTYLHKDFWLHTHNKNVHKCRTVFAALLHIKQLKIFLVTTGSYLLNKVHGNC